MALAQTILEHFQNTPDQPVEFMGRKIDLTSFEIEQRDGGGFGGTYRVVVEGVLFLNDKPQPAQVTTKTKPKAAEFDIEDAVVAVRRAA